jgi:flagellar basal body-associated protein FliL
VDLFSAEKSDVKSTVAEQIQFDNQEIYKKLGKIRSVTKDGIPLVISVYFPFDKDDTEFYEEISVKNESIKSMISGFFVNYTLDEIKTKGETFVKSELLKKINGKLVLSQIKEIYFEEYVFFD